MNGEWMPGRPRTDEQLLASAREGDQTAFAEIVVRYRPRIYALAYRITLDEDDALDIAQETAFALCRKVAQLRDDGALWAWLRRMTVNACLSLFRRRHSEREILAAWGREADVHAAAPENIVAAIQREQEIERVESALRALSPQQRAVFALRFHEERPLANIAQTMGLSLGAVKSHLFRATARLREMLAPPPPAKEESSAALRAASRE
ncbi:MAG: sigma-70 family RNA polymerase sigma factor [Candidatus Sumerlaeota bacterium]|nr:sigma-70 family RNA polymerase sigma factor [Candidatus Sumerlaeota bacterium]